MTQDTVIVLVASHSFTLAYKRNEVNGQRSVSSNIIKSGVTH